MTPAVSYLGQIVPIDSQDSNILQHDLFQPNGFSAKAKPNGRFELYVASTNAQKFDAAKKAVEIWAKKYINNPIISVHGYDVLSNIDEQPVGLEYTRMGVSNRLENMRLLLGSDTFREDDGTTRIIFAMENGIMPEKLVSVNNPQKFVTDDGITWVDRCIVRAEVYLNTLAGGGTAISVGVTTPKECVESARESNWTKTAGSFIADKYGCNPKDWHGSIAGKGRQAIIEDVCLTALGLKV